MAHPRAALDVNVVFGALIAGIALGSLDPQIAAKEIKQLSTMSMSFFIPIYFAMVGYTIDLQSAFSLPLFTGFLFFSTLVEGVCVFAAIYFLRYSVLTCFNFAVAMNTRGGPGIVLASMTFSLGLIDERLFVALTLTAVSTSLISGVWFRYLVQNDRPLMALRKRD